MADERTRSEYRLTDLGPFADPPDGPVVRPPTATDREGLSVLLLDAYRGSIDDEGEELDDAREAIDHYLGILLPEASLIHADGDRPLAASFVVDVDDVRYIDPIIVAADHKGTGLGTALVTWSLHRLRAAGESEVGAVITDGNTPSERLFAGLGFVRVGAW